MSNTLTFIVFAASFLGLFLAHGLRAGIYAILAMIGFILVLAELDGNMMLQIILGILAAISGYQGGIILEIWGKRRA